eukprot:Nitzschia sp. Nitz4//scaffold64_size103689//6433//7644//NITZ4_004420-RA/size103689-processed-gene-0.94-mRNA-1//-1//CDS//3329556082//7684//frame0
MSRRSQYRMVLLILASIVVLVGTFLRASPSLKESPVLVHGEQEFNVTFASNVKDQPPERPRFLLGIFTMDSDKDRVRRKMIRKTYLSMMSFFQDIGLDAEGGADRVCTLPDLLKPDGPARLQTCELVYAFVMGNYSPSNETAPTELSGHDASAYVVDSEDPEEPDILRLNLRENMNEGKTTTWFRYTSTMLPRHLGILLSAKVDTDAVLLPRALMRDVKGELDLIAKKPYTIRTYGGYRVVERGEEEIPYMQGGFYFMSRKLAQEITSSVCPRNTIIRHMRDDLEFEAAEDRDIGSFIHYCADLTSPHSRVRELIVSEYGADHHIRYKGADGFRVKWKQALAFEVANTRYQDMSERYAATGGCPPTPEAITAEMSWFEETERVGDRAKDRFLKLLLKASCVSQ